MKRSLLIARNEFIKYITRRGFIISLLMFPLWIIVAAVVPQWIERSLPTRNFTVIDQSGGHYAAALARAIDADTAAATLAELSHFARRHLDHARLYAENPQLAALLTASSSDSDARDQLVRAGGLSKVLQDIAPYRRDQAVFVAPKPRFGIMPPPQGLAHAEGDQFIQALRQSFAKDSALYAVLVLPENFGPQSSDGEYWSQNLSDPDLRRFVQNALGDALALKTLTTIAPTHPPELLQPSPRLRAFDPGSEQQSYETSPIDQAKFYAPAVLAFLLLLTVFMNAGSLLSGVIEEKSSRIVEVILSCVTPIQFMTGKLLGAAAASLLTLFLWGLMLVLASLIFLPDALPIMGKVLLSIFSSGLLPMLLLCFICGLLIYASIFLAIGSMATSIQDAQALVGPAMILVMAPLIMMPALLQDPNGPIATTLSWVPVYTPFFMMFRLPWQPPLWEVIGAISLMVTTTIFLVIQMGRIFAANVLTTERPPRLRSFLRHLLPRRG